MVCKSLHFPLFVTVIFTLAITFLHISVSPAQETGGNWAWAGEVGVLAEGVRTSGDDDATVRMPGTSFYSMLTLRGDRRSSDTHKDSFYMKLREPFSSRRRDDRLAHIQMKLQRGRRNYTIGDFTPRFQPWTIQYKRLTGLWIQDKTRTRSIEMFAGSERALPYAAWNNKNMAGARIESAISRHILVSSEYVSTRESGVMGQQDNRNSVWLNRIQYGKQAGSMLSVAHSRSTRFAGRADNALRVEGQFRKGRAKVNMEYEDVDNDFQTLSGYAIPGRNIFTTRMLMPVGPHIFVTTGYIHNKLPSYEITSVPVSLQVKPNPGKPLVIQVDYNEQKNSLAGGKSYNRASGVSLKQTLGPAVLHVGWLSDSYQSGESQKQTAFFDMDYRMLQNVTLRTRLQKEDIKNEDLPRHVYYMAANIDISDWSSLQLSSEVRDRTGQNQKRILTGARFRLFNPDIDTELGIDYKHVNYVDHVEQIFSAEITTNF